MLCLARKHRVPFLSLWYDSTRDWTLVDVAIGELFTHRVNVPVINKSYYIMPYNSQADGVHVLAERYATKSNVKLDRCRSQLQESYVASHIEELRYNETVCRWMIICTYVWSYCLYNVRKFSFLLCLFSSFLASSFVSGSSCDRVQC